MIKIPPSEFMPAFAFGAHADMHLVHLGWVAQVGGAGVVTCENCGQDNEVFSINVSRILGRDVSFEQFQRIIKDLDNMLDLERVETLPLESRIQVGPFWAWYTLGYPNQGEPRPAWWLGFGDSAHCVSRVDVEAWIVQAQEWERKIREEGWESMAASDPAAEQQAEEVTEIEPDPVLEWLRREMRPEESVEDMETTDESDSTNEITDKDQGAAAA